MPDLEEQIVAWRRQMATGGINSPSILDELESHLREDVERQMRDGISAERAFEVAVKKIGPARALKNEFKKSSVAGVLEKLMIAIAVLFVAFGVFLSTVTIFFCYASLGEQLIGFTAMGLIIATACGWPAFVPLLPIIPRKRKRQIIEVACLLAGLGLCTFYVQIILPHFERGPDRIIPGRTWTLPPVGRSPARPVPYLVRNAQDRRLALIVPRKPGSQSRDTSIIPVIGFFGLLPIAIGFGLACGLARAAQRAPEEITA
ncbi:MAG TPA: permease prefix domain 1-containing protein [Verrucomicrobiae bacterium]|jgi:hypothetical protein